MALDQVSNFIRGETAESITSTQTTISVANASIFPDPSSSQYNLVLWDADTYPRPDNDSNVEIVRVTGQDTTNDTLTISRGQEGTTGASHPNPSSLQLSPTAKMFGDIETELNDKLESSNYNPEADTHSKTTSASELSDVSPDSTSSAHHSKTSSASELSDVSADSNSDAHHSKTSSASDLSDVSPDSDPDAHHPEYTDGDARTALQSASQVGGSGLFFDFDNDPGWIELVDGGGTRHELVTSDVYLDDSSTWLASDHIGDTNAHHPEYTDTDARGAIENGALSRATFSTFEIEENSNTNSLDFNYTG